MKLSLDIAGLYIYSDDKTRMLETIFIEHVLGLKNNGDSIKLIRRDYDDGSGFKMLEAIKKY